MGQGPVGWLQLIDLAFIQLGLALVVGGAASSRWLSGGDSDWSLRFAARTARAARAGAVVGLAALVAAVWLQAAVMADLPLGQAGPTVLTLLRVTHYGHVALVGIAAWSVVVAAAWLGRAGPVLLLGLLVTAWSRSAVSHAANDADYSLDVAVDIVHILATSLWVGVVVIGSGLPRPTPAISDRRDASRWVRSLSACATAALGVVVLTGAFKVWRAVPDASLLPGSDYGRALFVKLALVAAAVLLGGYNRFRVLPGLRAALAQRVDSPADPGWTRRLVTVLRIEMGVLLLVVGWAARVASTEPPG